jgi:phage/conjugal plasmid C-4 type zinc finger TraR family protein
MTQRTEHFVFEANNEEEAEIAQLAALFENEALVRKQREKLAEQSRNESLTQCAECGDDIPELRRTAVKGCTLCVDCQQLRESGRI